MDAISGGRVVAISSLRSAGRGCAGPSFSRRRRTLAVSLAAAVLVAVALVLLPAVPPAGAAPSGAGPLAAAPGSAPPLLALVVVQQAALTAPDGVAGDFFGCSVAIDGDTALVGVQDDDIGGKTAQGSASVFVRSGAGWSFQQQLTDPAGAAGDGFGCAVALSGNTALVGTRGDEVDSNAGQGSACVFTRSGTHWTLQDTLTAGDGAAGDEFGFSVAVSGETVLVGAPYHDLSGSDFQGAAYVFVRSGATWPQQAKLTADDPEIGDSFGSSVALSGETALIGAPYHDVGSIADQGAAYVFVRSGATWPKQAQLSDPGAAASAAFGRSVALDGDTALVGARDDTVGVNAGQGSAAVFVRSVASWTLQQRLTAGDGAADDHFGYEVALDGETLVVGAPYREVGGVADQGAAYLFTRSGGTWSQDDQLTAADGAANDKFGFAAAVSGDTALLGAPSCTGARPGTAYVFVLDGAVPVTTAALTPAPNALGWYKAPVIVALTASDDVPGVVSTEYRRQGAANWQAYAAPFKNPTQGVSVWDYRSTDLAGRVETTRSFTLRLDSNRPITQAFKASVRRGKTVKLRYRVSDAVPGCGRAKVKVRIYKGARLKKTLSIKSAVACNAKKSYSWRCTLARGRYKVKFSATDIAGNAQSRAEAAWLTVR